VTPVRRALLLLLAAACAVPQRQPPASTPAAASASPTVPSVGRTDYADETAPARLPFESRALGEVLRALQKGGATARPSAALDRAAGLIAAAAARGEPDPLARHRVQEALGAAAAFDPAPRVHLATGPQDHALSALLARLTADGATHVGLADRETEGSHHVVLLLSRRRARIDRFPSTVATGSEVHLSGELVGLLHPRLFVTRPDGSSAELDVEGGRAFASRIRFDRAGRYAVEIVGTGGAGPEVAALLAVTAGKGQPASEPSAAPALALAAEPAQVEAAEAAVVDAVNRLRGAYGLPALTRAADLSALARRHSERMLAAGTVAHVLPGSPELAERLATARVRYRRALENVARGESSLAAHAATEASPAHRGNLLTTEATRVGAGIARGSLPTGERIVYLTEILIEPAPADEPDRLTPDARVREALWKERERRGLPPLTNDLALEGLARSAAAAMRAEDGGETPGLTEAALRLGRELAAVDAFIATGAAEALRSRNLTDPRFRRVGVGVVQGDSRRFGPGRLFVAVLYSN
jgi:uncharacterized protein YkwD